MSENTMPMLNVYEIQDDTGANRRLLCLVDGVRAGAFGIDPRSIVGEIPYDAFTPTDQFEPSTFRLNPGFVESITKFMNEVASASPDIIEQAKAVTTGWLYIVDGRHKNREDEPNTEDVVGAYAVDESGQVAPNTFVYNKEHKLFHEDTGVSGILTNADFYHWLHPAPESSS